MLDQLPNNEEEQRSAACLSNRAARFATLRTSSAEAMQLQRELWVLDGVLTHDLDQELLEQISEKFKNIDCVPTGYFYPELYASSPRQLFKRNAGAAISPTSQREQDD